MIITAEECVAQGTFFEVTVDGVFQPYAIAVDTDAGTCLIDPPGGTRETLTGVIVLGLISMPGRSASRRPELPPLTQ